MNDFPFRILRSVERDDAITFLQPSSLRCASRRDALNHRSGRYRHAIHQSADQWNHERRQNIHHGSSDRDQKFLPAWAQHVLLFRWNVGCTCALNWCIRFVAAEFDIAPKRNRGDAIIRSAPLAPPEARTESNGERLNTNL